MPIILKDKVVDFPTAKGSRMSYRYEDLASIVQAVDPVLAEHDLYVRFATSNTMTEVMVTCYISHADGYGIENTITGPIDLTGNKTRSRRSARPSLISSATA
jgi:hypothetical protein